MSTRNKPVGRVTAIIPPNVVGEADRFIPLGVIWPTKAGKFLFIMDTQPVCWSDPHIQRKLLIELSKEVWSPTLFDEDDPTPLPSGSDIPF